MKSFFTSIFSVSIVSAQLSLYTIPKDFANSFGAACLDGTPPAFYYAPAADPSFANKWIIFFEGGGYVNAKKKISSRELGFKLISIIKRA